MFDTQCSSPRDLSGVSEAGASGVDPAAWIASLPRLAQQVTNAERIDQIRVLEELKAAAAAAQARISVDLDRSSREEEAERSSATEGSSRSSSATRSVGSQIALARRESPNQGGRHLGFAKALLGEMPCTYAALEAGWLSEWRATMLVRESACLSVADRRQYDAELFADPGELEQMGNRQLVAQARKVAYRLDAASVVRRARRAESERRVTVRPAPDAMSYLTGLLPMTQGVAVFAALSRAADSCRAQGDERSRGQIMADALVERVTGQSKAQDVRLEVQLVMTDRTLLAGDREPALIPGYGTIPAGWARSLVGLSESQDDAAAMGGKQDLWIRRLYTAPTTGQLIAMDSMARRAPTGLGRFVDIRDQTCRTPWCDAPIRHRDHVLAFAEGGRTSDANLQGLCEHCNYVKQAPGWVARALAGWDQHEVEFTTPTGHRYRSRAPTLPGRPPSEDSGSLLERAMIGTLGLAA